MIRATLRGNFALFTAANSVSVVGTWVQRVAVGWLTWDQTVPMRPFTHDLFEVHGTIANLLWGYVILHVGTAVLHELFGHRLLRRMSPMPS